MKKLLLLLFIAVSFNSVMIFAQDVKVFAEDATGLKVEVWFGERGTGVKLISLKKGQKTFLTEANKISSRLVQYDATVVGGKIEGSIQTTDIQKLAKAQPEKDVLISFIPAGPNAVTYDLISQEKSPWSFFPAMGGQEGTDFDKLNKQQQLEQAAKVLGISKDSSEATARAARNNLVKQFHSDKFKNKPLGDEITKIINLAYGIFKTYAGK